MTTETEPKVIPLTKENTVVVIPVSVDEDPKIRHRARASTHPLLPYYWWNRGLGDASPYPLWEGFGQGRTLAMRDSAKEFFPGKEWLIMLDADDELVISGDNPVIFGREGEVYALECQHGDLRYYQPRVFHISVFLNDDPAMAWIGSTHEFWAGPVHANVHPDTIAYKINEDGYRRRTGQKLRDDYELLRKDLESGDVNHRRVRFYLAQTLAEMGKSEEAWAGYLECLEDKDQWAQERFVAGWRMLHMTDDPQSQVNLVVKLTELCPNRPEPHWFMARQLPYDQRWVNDPMLVMKLAQEIRDDYRRAAGSEEAVRLSGALFLSKDAMAWAWGQP